MPWEVARKFVDRVFEHDILSHPFPTTAFDFCGGETLLRPEFIDRCITYIKKKIAAAGGDENFKPIKYTVVTNGTLLGDPKVRELFTKHNIACGISLDGLPEIHNKLRCDSYSQIASNLEWWKANQTNPAVIMTVSTENVAGLAQGFRHIVGDLGINNIALSIVFDDENWNEDRYAELFYRQLIEMADFMCLPEHYDKVWCNVFDIGSLMPVHNRYPACPSTKTGLSVDYTGKLWTCFRFKNPSVGRDYSVGDVDNWIDEEKMAVFLNCTTDNVKGFEDCAQCDIGSGCKRCPGLNAEKSGGDICEGSINLCKVHHARFFATKYLVERRREIWEMERPQA
jgi:sulfatase maturation enzyme AslB (radical SAM superfamily)